MEVLTQAGREAKNKYQREWYKAHPGKNREYKTRSWNKKGAEAESLEKKVNSEKERC